MWDLVLMMLGDFSFWARVLTACLLWYIVACAISRCHCKSNASKLWSTKAAPWLALLFIAPLSGIGVWLWWNDILMAILLAIVTIIIPILFLLIYSGMEAAAIEENKTGSMSEH